MKDFKKGILLLFAAILRVISLIIKEIIVIPAKAGIQE